MSPKAIMFADQVAQTRSLQGRGVTASGILGHSGGEVAAAHIAGAMNLHDATRLVLARGETFRNLFGAGKMAALQASAKSAQELIDAFLADHGPMVLSIAAINSPDSVTLSGENAAVRGLYKLGQEAAPHCLRHSGDHLPLSQCALRSEPARAT